MNIINVLLITLYILIIMSFAQYPIWIVRNTLKSKTDNSNLTAILFSSLCLSGLLIFVCFSNIMTLFTGFELLEQKAFEYVSIFYGILLVAQTSFCIYFVISEYILSHKLRYQRNAIRVTAVIIIFIALLFLYSIIIANSETGANYVEISNNYILPLFSCILITPVLINLIQNKSIKAILDIKSILIIIAVFLAVIDIFIINDPSIQMIPLFYAVYAAIIYNNTSSYHNDTENEINKISKSDFMELHNISGREMEVIDLVCKGQTNNEIAESLILSPHTIKSHMKRIFTKLDIDSRHKLVNIMSNVENRD